MGDALYACGVALARVAWATSFEAPPKFRSAPAATASRLLMASNFFGGRPPSAPLKFAPHRFRRRERVSAARPQPTIRKLSIDQELALDANTVSRTWNGCTDSPFTISAARSRKRLLLGRKLIHSSRFWARFASARQLK